MKKTIRIGLLFICCFMNISLSYASSQNPHDLQNWGNLIRCQDCQQAKCCNQNPKCDLCPPCPSGPSGPVITRIFAYGGAYNNETGRDNLLINPTPPVGTAFRYTVFSTNNRVSFDPNREVFIDVTGDYLIKFIVSVERALFEGVPVSFPIDVGLELNGELVEPSFFTVSVPVDRENVAFTLKGQLILPLTAGDRLQLIVPNFGVFSLLLHSSSAANQPTLNTTLSVEKLN